MKPIKVLIADDKDEVADVLNLVVQLSGVFETETLNSGRAAFHAIRANHYDLIIMDNQMDEDQKFWGEKLVAHIRRELPDAKIILCSSEKIPEECEPDLFWPKPFPSLDEMIAAIKQWFPQ